MIGDLPDAIVVGSGPAGAQAAAKAVALGLSVVTVDVGERDEATAFAIPEAPFTELRRNDAGQRAYFTGELTAASVGDVRVGAQLTPPRQFIVRRAEDYGPLQSANFTPMQSFALGGLGAGWGSGCQTYTDEECRRAGLVAGEMQPFYDEVAADIGVSGAAHDDLSENFFTARPLQEPPQLDTNAASILAAYERARERLHDLGLRLGRATLALLTAPLENGGVGRRANPLTDMDFYSDATRSVYRPRWTIERLQRCENYRYDDRLLALRFASFDDRVELTCRDLRTGEIVTRSAKTLVLAAGAINTTRLVLRSFDAYGVRVPLISNAYHYIPTINLRMLGKPAADARHSMGQLMGRVAAGASAAEQLVLVFFSYRSLLLFKLVKEMPLPANVGLLAARVLMSSLAIVGVHYPDGPAPSKWLSLERNNGDDVLIANYERQPAERTSIRRGLRRVLRALLRLGLVPIGVVDPGEGASIHYAGSLPTTDQPARLSVSPRGHLHDAPRVFVADSAGWNFLPSKGPTFSIMANARRVSAEVARRLGRA